MADREKPRESGVDELLEAAAQVAPEQADGEADVKSLDTGAELSADEAFRQVTVEGMGRRDSGLSDEADVGLMDVDLDRLGDTGGAARARTDAEDMFAASDAEVRQRLQERMVAEVAEATYDESVLGGLSIGAFVGAVLGLSLFKFAVTGKSILATIGLALLGAAVGFGIGLAVGAGARAAVRSRRAAPVLVSLGILLIAAPVIALVVVLARWGFANHPIFAIATYALASFAAFVYVFQDAGYRGMGSSAAVVWSIVSGLCWPVIGLYMSRRPRGEMVGCPNCDRKHLAYLRACPHCGYVRKAGLPSREDLDLTNV